jgi:hypothetical protein
MRYLKYLAQFLLHFTLYILAVFLFPVAYWLRPSKGFLWWFLHDGNLYGYGHERYWKHYGKETFWVAYVWNVKRNSHWNFRTRVSTPKKGRLEDVKIHVNEPNNLSGLMFRNFENLGKQFATYSIDGSEYFRWSEAKEVSYFGFKFVRSLMFGWSGSRHVFKIRHHKA